MRTLEEMRTVSLLDKSAAAQEAYRKAKAEYIAAYDAAVNASVEFGRALGRQKDALAKAEEARSELRRIVMDAFDFELPRPVEDWR